MLVIICVLTCFQLIFAMIASGLQHDSEMKPAGQMCEQNLWFEVVQKVRQNTEGCNSEHNSSQWTLSSDAKEGGLCDSIKVKSFYSVVHQLLKDVALIQTPAPALNRKETLKLDLQAVELRVITDPWPPYIITKRDQTGNLSVSGFSIDLLEELSQLLNFTYVLEPEGGEWGVAQADGNWSGMVGQLQRKEKDMIIGALGFQPERNAAMEFTVPFNRVEVTMWILNPRLRRQIWLALFDMVDLAVMGLLLGTMVVLAIFLATTSKLLLHHHDRHELDSSVVNKAFILLGAILSQGSLSKPVTITGHLIIASWWIFSVVFSVTYSAILIASLSANSTQLPFKSAAEMFKQTEYKYGVFGSGTEQMYLQTITEELQHKELWKKIEEAALSDPGVLSTDYRVHADRVLKEKYVFIGVELPFSTDQPQQSVLKFGDVFFEKDICIGLQLNSPYKDTISAGLLRLMNFGIVTKLKKKWWSSSKAKTTEISDVDGIALRTLSGVFFTFGIGIGLSVLALLLELGLSHVHRETKHKRSKKRIRKITENPKTIET